MIASRTSSNAVTTANTNANTNTNIGASTSTSTSVSTDGSEKLNTTQSKENHDSNNVLSQSGVGVGVGGGFGGGKQSQKMQPQSQSQSHSQTDSALLDLIRTTASKLKSPARKGTNIKANMNMNMNNNSNIGKGNSNNSSIKTDEKKSRNGSSSITSNGTRTTSHSHSHSYQKDCHSLLSVDTSTGGGGIVSRDKRGRGSSHTTASATSATASATDNIGAAAGTATAATSNISSTPNKAPQSGLTIKVDRGSSSGGFTSPNRNTKTSNNSNLPVLNTPEMQISQSNSNNGTGSNHFIKMNPRDSASPRRNRGRSSKSKAYKEYETSIIEKMPTSMTKVMPMSITGDSISLNSWKEEKTIGSTSNASVSISRASTSVQSSSVGGLAYVETPSTTTGGAGGAGDSISASASGAGSNRHHNQFNYKQSYHQHQHYHITNAANSVSSKSATSKRSHRSHRSKSSHASHSHRQQQHSSASNTKSLGPGREEQILFEQRLCEEGHGVAVRKIHSNGKSQLRFVKCVPIPKDKLKKLTSGASSSNRTHNHNHNHDHKNMSYSLPSPNVAQEVSSARSVTSLGLMGRMTARKNKSALYNSSVDDNSPKSQQTKSISVAGESTISQAKSTAYDEKKYTKALTWGNKKKVLIPLFKFIAVRKGKTTKRTRRNGSDASRLLSIVTSDEVHGSLDIEAPTKLDRDKFAKAFSVFLSVPLEDGLVGESVVVNKDGVSSSGHAGRDPYLASVSVSSHSLGDMSSLPSTSSYNSTLATPVGAEYKIGSNGEGALLPNLTPSPCSDEPKLFGYDGALGTSQDMKRKSKSKNQTSENSNYADGDPRQTQGKIEVKASQESNVFDMDPKLLSKGSPRRDHRGRDDEGDDVSAVSSLTQGFDQEIVEELHQALTELRAELDASRAEAARAVKVAEQAIQSAESCSSNDWNSTVTHKAAEAAAQAQKRSAEAIVKQRQAEEKLAAEKKSASFWRKQAQIAEEDAGGLQTRLAVAEVERAGITEELEREKRKAASYIQAFKRDYAIAEGIQRETLANSTDQNKLLEMELDGTRRDLAAKAEEVKMLQDSIAEMKIEMLNVVKEKSKKKFFGKSKKSRDGTSVRGRLLLDSQTSSTGIFANCNDDASSSSARKMTSLHSEQLLKIQAETADMKKQYQLLRRTTIDELKQLPNQAKDWASAASKALIASQSEVQMLKSKLAMEMANRRKLLDEVQDLRGSVRVYCRPRPITSHNSIEDGSSPVSIVSVPSHEVGLLHRELLLQNGTNPMSFEFDRMFTSNTTQRDVYAEMEELVLTSLDGYNSSLISFGQNGCGKTHSLFGDFSITRSEDIEAEPHVEISDCGVHLLAMQQIFTVSEKRSERFHDSFSLTIVEIHDEKLTDLVAETDIALSSGQVLRDCDRNSRIGIGSTSNSHTTDKKLEIRTNIDGETIVQGLVTIPIKSYQDVEQVWKQSLAQRAKRVQQLGKKLRSYDASSHIVATLQVASTNSVSGVGTIGKVQFFDLAASDVVPRRTSLSSKSKATPMDNILAPIGNTTEWKYANKSISQLADVVNTRYQYSRSVPYRNSTLTHLLQDSLESDTKVLLLACVSSDAKDLQNTANTMRFAAKMKKVVVGKATKHTLSFA